MYTNNWDGHHTKFYCKYRNFQVINPKSLLRKLSRRKYFEPIKNDHNAVIILLNAKMSSFVQRG